VLGLEGVGRIVKANGENLQQWVGKRVTFFQQGSGSWAEYSLAAAHFAFPVDEDVPVPSAASGLVNPLTVVGMTDIYQKFEHKGGIIHTAAASALGRMLNKRCIRLGIPLLNIVRRQEQADLLKSEGAQHIIITQGDWQKEYAEAIDKHGFNVLFDALGGGAITETLILGLKPNSKAHTYGGLEGKPLNVDAELLKSRGTSLSFYHLMAWLGSISEDEKLQLREAYSGWLKSELATTSYKILPFSQISEAIELSVSKATEGKITLIPE
jgi:NADPH:quinone reductase-like Zn-dependent oxidoreductase